MLIELISDERVFVDVAEARFAAALDKRDRLADDNSSDGVARIRARASVEEARLISARQRLAAATENLRAFSVAKFGATSKSARPKNKQDSSVGKDKKHLKRKLPTPKDGYLDPKGIIIRFFTYRHCLFQPLSNMFVKMREMIKGQSNLTPDGLNIAKRAEGVKRVNLLNPNN